MFVPNHYLNGSALFEGYPCPTKEVFNDIGLEGVEYLDKKIKKVIEYRIELFGIRLFNIHGLHNNVKVFDKKLRNYICLSVFNTHNDLHHVEASTTRIRELHDKKLKQPGNYILAYFDGFGSHGDSVGQEVDSILKNIPGDSELFHRTEFKLKDEGVSPTEWSPDI